MPGSASSDSGTVPDGRSASTADDHGAPTKAVPGPHEWLEVDLGDESVQLDLTFLTSSWHCIWGAGCQGILESPAPELAHGCCSHGAYFDNKRDRKRVRDAIDRLDAADWELHDLAEEVGGAVTKDEDGSWVTRTHDGACIMLNRPGFSGGAGCALHGAALRHGERPLDWKPYVCWQLPLRLDFHRDDNGHLTSFLREWKRRDWGEGGEEFHWWCTEAPEAFTNDEPVYLALRDEIIELVGQEAYDALVDHVEARGRDHLLPHPVLKRRPVAADRHQR